MTETAYTNYESSTRLHVVPELGRIRLSKLSAADVQAFYGTLVDKGLKPKNIAVRLSGMLERAFELDLISKNPAKQAKLPRSTRTEMPMLSHEETHNLIRAAEGHRLEALLILSISIGLRQGEALALQWAQVDLERGEVAITHTLKPRKGGGQYRKEPKTTNAVRRVLLPSQAIEALKRHRVAQAAEELASPVWRNDLDLVFTDTIGQPVRANNLTRRDFKSWLSDAGLSGRLTWHGMRHVALSRLLGEGVPVTDVAQIAGHANPAITLRLYSHAIPGQQTFAREAMERLLA